MACPTFKMLGSKARMAKWILEHAPQSRYARWIEPFTGRGNVYFRALHDRSVGFNEGLLNDRYMIGFVEALRDYSGDWSFVDSEPIDRALLDKWQAAPDSHERWLAESYVCRMGGSFAFGKPGPNTTCDRNRHSRENTIKRMVTAQGLLRSKPTKTSAEDWETFLRRVQPTARDIVYVDPPYNTANKVPYPNIDHEALLSFLDNSPATVMLSGFDSELYDAWLQAPKWQRIERERSITAGRVVGKKKPKKLEVLWIKA